MQAPHICNKKDYAPVADNPLRKINRGRGAFAVSAAWLTDYSGGTVARYPLAALGGP